VNKTPTNQEIQNFQPKCLSEEGINVGRSIAVTATGFVLPCCWLDHPDTSEEAKVKTLLDPQLHIDNNDTIEDIIESEAWQKFMNDLVNKPEESADICFKMCCTKGNPHRKQEKL